MSDRKNVKNIIKRIFKKKKDENKNEADEELKSLTEISMDEYDSKSVSLLDKNDSLNMNKINKNSEISNFGDQITDIFVDDKKTHKNFLNIINLEEFNQKNEEMKQKDIEEGKAKIISSIEQIYFGISDNNPKFNNGQLYIIFLIIAILGSSLWNSIEQKKNKDVKIYCFDTTLYEFRICEASSFCKEGVEINSIFYLNKKKLIDFCKNNQKKFWDYISQDLLKVNGMDYFGNNIKEELPSNEINQLCENYKNLEEHLYEMDLINKVFKNFVIKEYFIFLEKSFSIANLDKESNSIFKSVIVMTTLNEYNFEIFTQNVCFNETSKSVLLWIGFNAFGYIIGCFFLTFLSDYYGRKKIIIISLFFGIIGSFLGCFIYSIKYIATSDSYEFQNEKLFVYLSTKELILLNYDNMINEMFITTFNIFSSMNLSRMNLLYYSSLFTIFLQISNFLASLCFSGSLISCMALALELAVNNDQLNNNFKLIMISLVSSHSLYYITSILINSQFYFNVFLLISTVILFIVCLLFLKESPRYHFEYGNYKELTKFAIESNSIKNLDYHLKYSSDQIYNYEFNLYDGLKFYSFWSIGSLLFYNNDKTRFSPFKIYSLIKKNPKLKKDLKIIFCLNIIASFSFYLIYGNYLRKDFYKVNYYDNRLIILTQIILYLDIIKIFSIIVVEPIIKYFGMSIVLYSSFFITSILSLVLGIIDFETINSNDYDKNFRHASMISDKWRGTATNLFIFILFFSTSQMYCLFYHLIKFTKTIYRCIFLGLFFFIFQMSGYLTFNLYVEINTSMLYVFFINILGLILSIFLTDNMEESVITDNRKVKLIY